MKADGIIIIIGVVLMVLGAVAQFGIGKSEIFGKTGVSRSHRIRLKIGWILMGTGFAVCVAAFLLAKFNVI